MLVDQKVIHGDFVPVKNSGIAPCARYGHQMSYLPVSCAILITGGRNDELCGSQVTPFLNDIFLFLLDQKAWLKVKYA